MKNKKTSIIVIVVILIIIVGVFLFLNIKNKSIVADSTNWMAESSQPTSITSEIEDSSAGGNILRFDGLSSTNKVEVSGTNCYRGGLQNGGKDLTTYTQKTTVTDLENQLTLANNSLTRAQLMLKIMNKSKNNLDELRNTANGSMDLVLKPTDIEVTKIYDSINGLHNGCVKNNDSKNVTPALIGNVTEKKGQELAADPNAQKIIDTIISYWNKYAKNGNKLGIVDKTLLLPKTYGFDVIIKPLPAGDSLGDGATTGAVISMANSSNFSVSSNDTKASNTGKDIVVDKSGKDYIFELLSSRIQDKINFYTQKVAKYTSLVSSLTTEIARKNTEIASGGKH